MNDLLEDTPLIVINGEPFVLIRDAAKVLDCSRQWIASLIASGRLVARRMGPRTRVVSVASLRAYSERQ